MSEIDKCKGKKQKQRTKKQKTRNFGLLTSNTIPIQWQYIVVSVLIETHFPNQFLV